MVSPRSGAVPLFAPGLAPGINALHSGGLVNLLVRTVCAADVVASLSGLQGLTNTRTACDWPVAQGNECSAGITARNLYAVRRRVAVKR